MALSMARALSCLCCCLFATTALAQQQNAVYQSYISQYANMAIDQMNRYGIPASITLSQGLLESGAGRSTLAIKANNHFGIKVGSGWTGPYVVRDDDKPNERFRKYSSVAESYEDHSRFLQKDRYAPLFKLKTTDYKGWARGLKACGYATSPTYAENLINIIELYKLHDFDHKTSTHHQQTTSNTSNGQLVNPTIQKYVTHAPNNFFSTHPVAENNKNYYIRVAKGDNLLTIAMAVGVSERRLRKYNELPKDMPLTPGSILYLNAKRSKADKGFKYHPHIVMPGQSMYDIAQMYGIKLKSLYKMNMLMPDYQPRVGDVLRIY